MGQYTNMDASRWVSMVGNAVVDTLGGGLKISSLSLPVTGKTLQPTVTGSVPLREEQAASFHILLVGTAAMVVKKRVRVRHINKSCHSRLHVTHNKIKSNMGYTNLRCTGTRRTQQSRWCCRYCGSSG